MHRAVKIQVAVSTLKQIYAEVEAHFPGLDRADEVRLVQAAAVLYANEDQADIAIGQAGA